MRSFSIRASITGWFVALTMLLLVAFSVALREGIGRTLRDGLDQKLRASAEGLLALCEWEEDVQRIEFDLDDSLARKLAALNPGRWIEVRAWPSGELLHRSGAPLDEKVHPLDAPTPASAEELLTIRHADWTSGEGTEYRTCTVLARLEAPDPLIAGTGPARAALVRVAEDRGSLEERLGRITWILLGLSLAALFGTFALGLFLSRRVTRRLKTLGDAAREIRAGNATGMPRRGTADEIESLAEILDEAFSSLQTALQEQARFTANASHELRNPISVLQSSADVALQSDREPGEYRAVLRDVRATARRMGGIVEALLLLARMDAGEAAASFEEVDLPELVKEAIGRASRNGGGDGIVLGPAPPSRVHGDRHLLGILLDNLLANARVHAGRTARVEVSVRRAEGGSVFLEVRDDGPGIPAAERERVFDRFHRAAPGRGDRSGAGLGLSIVAAIARLHGATCELGSEKAGAAVRVTFEEKVGA